MVFMSESQAFFEESMENLHLARRNRLPAQRAMDDERWAFKNQAGDMFHSPPMVLRCVLGIARWH